MPTSASEPVGIIGLGAIGGGVARAMVGAGVAVMGTDISAEARAAFAEAGGDSIETAAQIGTKAKLVFLFLVNAGQARRRIGGGRACGVVHHHGAR